MTKHYLPDPVMAFDIGEDIINRGRYDGGKPLSSSRLRECFPKVITFFFIIFLFGGGTFLGLTVTTMPIDQAGYVVNENDDMFIYYPGSLYFLSPSVILKIVDINDRNITTIDKQQCNVSIFNIKSFIYAVHKNNDSVDEFYQTIMASHHNHTTNNRDDRVVVKCHTGKDTTDQPPLLNGTTV